MTEKSVNLRKQEVLTKNNLHGENSSLGFTEVVLQLSIEVAPALMLLRA